MFQPAHISFSKIVISYRVNYFEALTCTEFLTLLIICCLLGELIVSAHELGVSLLFFNTISIMKIHLQPFLHGSERLLVSSH